MSDHKNASEATEWAAAWFVLDDMMHRACHTAAEAVQMRKSSKPPEEIEGEIQKAVIALRRELRRWKDRPVVKSAEETQKTAEATLQYEAQSKASHQGISSSSSSLVLTTAPTLVSRGIDDQGARPRQFLSYPPFPVTNVFYCNLISHYNAIEIMLSLIEKPLWHPPDLLRLEAAVEICRLHAVVGVRPDDITFGKIWVLFLTGLAFAGPDAYPVRHSPVRD